MRYTTTDGPKKPLNAIQEGSLGDKMGIAGFMPRARLKNAKKRKKYTGIFAIILLFSVIRFSDFIISNE